MPIDLRTTYLLLENDGDALELPVSDDFWQQLMSDNPQDAKAQRLATSDGRLVSGFEMSADWDHWENHPAGDEVLILVSGEMTILLEEETGVREWRLGPGSTCVIPRGVWHTAKIPLPCQLIAITPGRGTRHRALSGDPTSRGGA
ncbi:MAG: cupin domain-containing protein [Planctomycetes bacterium]|nr:cupin domain-containing protein [Planctomycetota bacterium]